MDDLDRQILSQLREDGRRSFTAIAERLGKSEGMVRNRVNRLIEEGALTIHAVVNPAVLGYHVQAFIGVTVEPPLIEDVAMALLQYEEVSYLAWSSGRVDLLVQVVCRDNDHFISFFKKLNQVEGVRSTETNIILHTYRQRADWEITT
ncbi:MAG: Lrp/AsnC family transcriptional regulator [Anaerolineae bacterium]